MHTPAHSSSLSVFHLCKCKGKNLKVWYLYSASSEMHHFWSAQVWITQLLHCKHTTPRKRLPDGVTHLVTAYYSFIDPTTIKGWVDLVSWPTADGLNGYPSAAGLVQARESSPVRDRRSSTKLHDQPTEPGLGHRKRKIFVFKHILITVSTCL